LRNVPFGSISVPINGDPVKLNTPTLSEALVVLNAIVQITGLGRMVPAHTGSQG